MSSSVCAEAILEPDLPIVDAHHHLWMRTAAELQAMEKADNLMATTLAPTFRRHARYLLDEFLSDARSGHNVRATVYVEGHSMYRASGPESMRSVGEVEFANGMASMAASGLFGDIAVCAGIVGSVDLRLGDDAEPVLRAHMQAGGDRYRGIRAPMVVYDEDPSILGANLGGVPHLLLDERFRRGFRHLQPLGLSYEAWQTEYQLPDLVDLVRAFPDTQVIINHVGGLFGVGRHRDRSQERFARWAQKLRALASSPNVAIKLGGLGMPICGLAVSSLPTPPTSEQLAAAWGPYVNQCIEAFGVERCMFESNFPVDGATTTYPMLWNAFKRIVGGASEDEKAALFSETAKRIYRLEF